MAATASAPRSVGEIDSFIMLLRTACSDMTVNTRLERLLSLGDEERKAVVHAWVTDLVVARAPRDFIQAIACLADDAVAEKAHEVIYQCPGRARWVTRASRPPWVRRPALILLAALAAVLAAALAAWLVLPGRALREIEPADSLRERSPAVAAYEHAWWRGARESLTRLCAGLPATASGRYAFLVGVDGEGAIVRVTVNGTSPDSSLGPRVEQVLKEKSLPAFNEQQRSEKKTLALRGNLFIRDGKCEVQRA